MLSCNNITGVSVPPGVEKVITEFRSTGSEFLVGFTGTGTYSGEFRLYVGTECYYIYQTSPGNRTAYIADRGMRIPAGEVISLRVVHDDAAMQVFKGTILGGK